MLALNGLDYTVEEWTPADSVAWLKAMAWDLRGNMEDEIDRAIASGRLAPRTTSPSSTRPTPTTGTGRSSNQGALVDGVYEPEAEQGGSRKPARPAYDDAVLDALEDLDAGLDAMPELLGKGEGIGSNAWVVDGEHSTTGQPILANDPHLGISVPGIWYQMGLHCNAGHRGLPVRRHRVHLRRAARRGDRPQPARSPGASPTSGPTSPTSTWRRSTARPTSTTASASRCRCATRPSRCSAATSRSRSRCAPPEHGPLLSDVSARAEHRRRQRAGGRRGRAPDRGNGYAVALAWTALDPQPTADAIFALDRATGLGRVPRRRGPDFAAPSQNMVYADREGHIGYQAPGLIPIRKSGNSGALPGRGLAVRRRLDRQLRPVRRAAHVLDPEDGFVATANQAVIGAGLPVLPRRLVGLRLPQPADRRAARAQGQAQRRGHGARSSSTTATASPRRWCPTCSTS